MLRAGQQQVGRSASEHRTQAPLPPVFATNGNCLISPGQHVAAIRLIWIGMGYCSAETRRITLST